MPRRAALLRGLSSSGINRYVFVIMLRTAEETKMRLPLPYPLLRLAGKKKGYLTPFTGLTVNDWIPCWHWPQRLGGPARVRAKSTMTPPAICRTLVKLPNSERLYVSFMAFSSGLLWMFLLPRGRPTLQPNQELSNAQLVARSYSGPTGITPRPFVTGY